MTIKYMTTSFLGDELLGVETMTVNLHDLLVSSPERAILECLNLPDASSSLLDIYCTSFQTSVPANCCANIEVSR